MQTEVKIYRDPHSKQTLGELYVFNDDVMSYHCKTLELPWLDNQTDISCIPDGTYTLVKHTSPTWGKCLKVLDVPNRSDILFHAGNFAASINPKTKRPDIKGCVLPGKMFTDIDKDGYIDIASSGTAMKEIMNVLPDQCVVVFETLNFHVKEIKSVTL